LIGAKETFLIVISVEHRKCTKGLHWDLAPANLANFWATGGQKNNPGIGHVNYSSFSIAFCSRLGQVIHSCHSFVW